MKHTNKHEKSFTEVLQNHKSTNQVFLGVGIILFLLNISSLLSFMPTEYSYVWFNVSVFSSMIIILVAVYNIYK